MWQKSRKNINRARDFLVITFLSPELPELYVVAMVELQASLYQGIKPFSVAEETLRVQMELV